ncbi:hypothetical protein H1R20_g15656, partial [Candolleomyces eurysporus]
MSLLQLAYVPYTHGEPLVAIPEVPEVEDVRNDDRLSGLPLHVLSNVLMHLVDSSLDSNSPYVVHNLISVSHVNYRIWDACLHNPALWNRVLSLNGIGPRLFEAIIDRAGTLSLSLSLREDETLSTTPEVWKILMDNLLRLQSLYVEVDQAYEGIKARFLLTLLTVDAPALEDCVVVFQAPHFFIPLLELMPNVGMIAATVPQVYSNPSFINILGRQELFPKVTSLGIPLNGDTVDAAYIPQLLRRKRAIKQVVFYISPIYLAEMEHDNPDPVRAAIGDLAKDFPDGIEIEWHRN